MSYEAVRNYHYDREPSASYIARVAEIFPRYSLAFLHGLSDDENEQAAEARVLATAAQQPPSPASDAAEARVLATAAQQPPSPASDEERRLQNARRLTLSVLNAVGVDHTGGDDPAFWPFTDIGIPSWVAPLAEARSRLWYYMMVDSPSDRVFDIASDAEMAIAEALNGPIAALGIDAKQITPELFTEYVYGMMPALLTLVAEKTRQRQAQWSAESNRLNRELETSANPMATRQPSTAKARSGKKKAPAKKPRRR